MGKINKLAEIISKDPISGNSAIGHTRWATHGKPSTKNAHPHKGTRGDVVVVHNGIIENYKELKDKLVDRGISFKSDTDTEVVVHLIEMHLSEGLNFENSVKKALRKIKGSNGISKNIPAPLLIRAAIGPKIKSANTHTIEMGSK